MDRRLILSVMKFPIGLNPFGNSFYEPKRDRLLRTTSRLARPRRPAARQRSRSLCSLPEVVEDFRKLSAAAGVFAASELIIRHRLSGVFVDRWICFRNKATEAFARRVQDDA